MFNLQLDLSNWLLSSQRKVLNIRAKQSWIAAQALGLELDHVLCFQICTEMSVAAKLIVTIRLHSLMSVHILHPSIPYHSQSQSCHVAPEGY